MLHIPVLRHGQPYRSVDQIELVHHATGEPVAIVSQANSGMIVRDVRRMDDAVLERFAVAELLDICRRAAERFISATLPVGDPAGGQTQSFDDYIRQLSATTGMPVTYCRNNAEKIRMVLAEMPTILAGLTRGFPLDILDRGHGMQDGRALSFHRAGRIFGAVLPSNSPGVHGLWIPAVALKTPIVLKPGREEPWTPLRIIESLAAAGLPREAFGFYPTDHAGAAELLRVTDRSMLFGDASTTRPWRHDQRVEIHGPGYSKVLLGDDTADDWPRYVDLMASSIAANGGRSCINASAVWTPRHGRAIAEALAERLAAVRALPADDPAAEIAAFANPQMAERISAMIDQFLRVPGAEDVTQRRRGSSRLVYSDELSAISYQPSASDSRRTSAPSLRNRGGESRISPGASPTRASHGWGTHASGGQPGGRRGAYLLPTIIWCEPLAREPLVRESLLAPHAGNITDRRPRADVEDESSGPAGHLLANREFLFPYASVVECPTERMPDAIGPSLVVSAITSDRAFADRLMASPNVDRLNLGPIPTWRISWDQPHEGNLFEHLYRRRAFQMEPAA